MDSEPETLRGCLLTQRPGRREGSRDSLAEEEGGSGSPRVEPEDPQGGSPGVAPREERSPGGPVCSPRRS